ncbi:MAG: hypothetical protein CL470_06060 [Acidimicrobiaceae bacterium]|nr:hypothetical protein [Acidimicrobiaceae bacterium]
MIAFVGQMDSAMKIANKVSEHSNENELSPDSLIAGLVYRLMVPMSNEEIKQSLEIANDIVNKETSEEENSEEENLEDDVIDHDFNQTIHNSSYQDHSTRVLKRNNCTCPLCIKVRECFDNFKQHETNDKLALMFKDAIQNACDRHNITF